MRPLYIYYKRLKQSIVKAGGTRALQQQPANNNNHHSQVRRNNNRSLSEGHGKRYQHSSNF